ARVITHHGLTMTTGAPLGAGAYENLSQAIPFEESPRKLKAEICPDSSSEHVHALNRGLIRMCLEHGGGAYTDLRTPPVERGTPRGWGSSGPSGSISRNDPCPCGSGKKFKHCCGGRKRS